MSNIPTSLGPRSSNALVGERRAAVDDPHRQTPPAGALVKRHADKTAAGHVARLAGPRVLFSWQTELMRDIGDISSDAVQRSGDREAAMESAHRRAHISHSQAVLWVRNHFA